MNLFARIRRSRTRGARYVAAAFSVAYLSAALAPCVAAASPASSRAGAEVLARSTHVHVQQAKHEGHHGHEASRAATVAHQGHDIDGHADVADERGQPRSPCPHCPDGLPSSTAMSHDGVHATCSVAAAVTDLAASKAHDAAQSYAVPFVPAAFALPSPLASPRPPVVRPAERAPSVALNVRHCVFLI